MKTQVMNKYLILFDAECPICNWAAGTNTANNLLGKNGMASYQGFQSGACPVIDRQRAANEVALLDVETGEVTYGVKSLFKVLAQAAPLLKPLLGFGPLVSVMSKVYKLFSLNRRVIVPSAAVKGDVQPAFHVGYRITYLIIAVLATAFVLTHYVQLMAGVLPVGNAYREYLVCGGQIVVQGFIINLIAQNKSWNYLGSMMTISLGGALLLFPVLLISGLIGQHPYFYAAYFMLVAGTMFLEHIRRNKLLGLGFTLTISWVLYRVVVLLFILH